MIQFPRHFLWGAATSAYQVEGNNINSDWWAWEKEAGLKVVSGQACRHYELYRQDFDLARAFNHNAHRLSVEWSRIEPEEGKFSAHELDHYLDVILSLKQRGLEPILTLHHFTNPLWFTKSGGWLNRSSTGYFLRFVEKVVRTFNQHLRYWITINEPLVYLYHSYIIGKWPPQDRSLLRAWHVACNLSAAHIAAYKLIHRLYKDNGLASPYVSIANNMPAFIPCRPVLKDRLSAYLKERLFNMVFLENLIRHRSLDFIGINYYHRTLVEVKRWGLRDLLLDTCDKNHHALPKNSLGWDIYPEGIYGALMRVKKYNLAVIILENGICTADDAERWYFIKSHLENIHRALREGVNVAGYMYWSLIDNYEWDNGFSARFGLVEVDYNTYERRPRESANKFAAVCNSGRLD